MQTFATAREAKEYLVQRILLEAQREGVSLPETERKMLYFSETAWTLPDMAEVAQEFDSHCNQGEYERKIVRLIRNLHHTLSHDRAEAERWRDAVGALGREDHYMLVLIDGAQTKRRNRNPTYLPRMPSPFADPAQRRAEALYSFPVELFDMLRSASSPRRSEPAAWYSRAIRAVAGVVLLFLFIAVVVMGWLSAVKGG